MRWLGAAALIALTTAAGELPTPMAERVATIVALDKRTSAVGSYQMKPGDVVRFGGLTIRLRACEAAAPWERPEAGAFVQVDEALKKGGARRVYSGWLFARSPGLSTVEHPNYDVWVKACAMRFPETGPDTVALGGDKPPKDGASKAKKSPRREIASANNAL